MAYDNWSRFLIHITKSYPNNDLYLGDNPYEKFLIEFIKSHPEMSEEQIYDLAPVAYSNMQEVSKKVKKDMDAAIVSVQAVAAKYESTWNEPSLNPLKDPKKDFDGDTYFMYHI